MFKKNWVNNPKIEILSMDDRDGSENGIYTQ